MHESCCVHANPNPHCARPVRAARSAVQATRASPIRGAKSHTRVRPSRVSQVHSNQPSTVCAKHARCVKHASCMPTPIHAAREQFGQHMVLCKLLVLLRWVVPSRTPFGFDPVAPVKFTAISQQLPCRSRTVQLQTWLGVQLVLAALMVRPDVCMVSCSASSAMQPCIAPL